MQWLGHICLLLLKGEGSMVSESESPNAHQSIRHSNTIGPGMSPMAQSKHIGKTSQIAHNHGCTVVVLFFYMMLT